MSERSCAKKFWEMAVSANWTIQDVQVEIRREPGVIPVGRDFRFADGSCLKLWDVEGPPRYAPDEEWVERKAPRQATAVEIAQQKAAGG